MMLLAADVLRKKLDEEMLAELEEWAMNIEEVREALIEWENLSSKKKNQVEYEARLKELRDLLNNFKGYHKMGIEEGMELGIQKIAKKMLEKGKPISEIAELSGLTEEEIGSLKE
jgi:predicted transposase/invertase (TIGR01784 family)